MKLAPQILDELTEYDWRWDFSYRDIPSGIANNTAQVFPLSGIGSANPQMRASDQIVQAYLHIITPFANTADTAFNSDTMSLGDQASATRFFSAVEGNLNGTYVVDTYYSPNNAYIYTAAALPQYLQFTLNSMTGKSLSNLNQGKIVIYIQVYRAGAKEKNIDLTKPAYV